jgi:uncharacterized protein (TIGR03086 family)
MTGTPPRATPWGGVELLERALGYTRGCLTLVRPEHGRAPSPCAGWDLRDLLTHMDDSLASLHEAGTGRTVAVPGAGRAGFTRQRVKPPCGGEPSATDLVDSLRDRACTLLGEWSADWALDHAGGNVSVGDRPVTPRVLTSAGALEVTVHGWDVARTCGADRPIPDALAEDLLRLAPRLVTPGDRPGRFAPVLAVDPLAAPGSRLLAFLGRDPRPPERPG